MLKSPRASLTAVRIGGPLALLLSLSSLFGGGCYSPRIGDGTLRCADKQRCPRGFHCRMDNLCWRTADAAIDGRPDTDGPVERVDTRGPDDRSDVVDQMGGDDVRDAAQDNPLDIPPPIDVPVTDTPQVPDTGADRPTDVCVGAACDLKPNGAPCADNAMCASGHCVDRVCCNSACPGQCMACDVSSSPGTCSQVNGPPRPGRGSCAGSGLCAGSCKTFPDRCTFPGGEITCAAAVCEDTTFTPARTCNGAGLCAPPAPASCDAFRCNATGTACLTSCASDNDCSQPAAPYCVQQACAAHRPNGASCVLNGECNSTHCIDKVCCDQACQGSCEACDLSDHLGTCTPVPTGQPHGDRPQCGGVPKCAGFCNGLPSGACFFPPRSVSCDCGLLGLGACNGDGTCHMLGLGGGLGGLCVL